MLTIHLTCADKIEAEKIRDRLLEERLIACGKILPISSKYWHDNKLEEDVEVLLIMETISKKFANIEEIVEEIHSYETFVLAGYEVSKVSADVEKWLKDSL